MPIFAGTKKPSLPYFNNLSEYTEMYFTNIYLIHVFAKKNSIPDQIIL